jgi:hypothetical protein
MNWRRNPGEAFFEGEVMYYIQIFLLGAVIVILATLFSLRRSHIRVEYSVSWLVVGAILLVCTVFPGVLMRVAAELGLEPQIGFIFLAGALAVALLFEVSLVVSQLRDENVLLTQRLAILEYHLQEIQSEHGVEAK